MTTPFLMTPLRSLIGGLSWRSRCQFFCQSRQLRDSAATAKCLGFTSAEGSEAFESHAQLPPAAQLRMGSRRQAVSGAQV